MQQPTAMCTPPSAHQLQLKILDCTDESARHANAETKIAVHLAMKHLEAQGADVTGDKVKELIKDIGIAYSHKRKCFTINVNASLHLTIKEEIINPFDVSSQEGTRYTLQFAEIRLRHQGQGNPEGHRLQGSPPARPRAWSGAT